MSSLPPASLLPAADGVPAGIRRSTAAQPAARQTLGQADFLTLLTTQLRNQDPLSPMDNEAFVAQLAQFSTVSGITEMNQSLASLVGLMRAQSAAAAPSWLGASIELADAGGEARVASVSFADDGSLFLGLDDGRLVSAASVLRLVAPDRPAPIP